MTQSSGMDSERRARHYASLHYGLSVLETTLLVLFLCAWIWTGVSLRLSHLLSRAMNTGSAYITAPVYLTILALVYGLVTFPVTFYHSFLLEHQFNLSRQSVAGWFADQFKAQAVWLVTSCICVEAFYLIRALSPLHWWMLLAGFWILFMVLLSHIAPVVLVPLFFTSKPFTGSPQLAQRIRDLARDMHLPILDIFQIDFSRKTLKANAGLTGWGATRRVLLADTLQERYSDDEILFILAHEFAHQRLRHLPRLLTLQALLSVLFFYLVSVTHEPVLAACGLPSLDDPASLVLLMLYFVVWGVLTQPLVFALSRSFELQADRMAVAATGSPQAFVRTMEKLARQNLNDRNPHPLVKFFFFDHPPTDERIAALSGQTA